MAERPYQLRRRFPGNTRWHYSFFERKERRDYVAGQRASVRYQPPEIEVRDSPDQPWRPLERTVK